MGKLVPTQARGYSVTFSRSHTTVPAPCSYPGRPPNAPHPSHCPPTSLAWTTLPEVLGGPQGRGHLGCGGGGGTCRGFQPMESPVGRSRAAVWRFCARPGLLVLRVWPGGSDRAGGCGALEGGGGRLGGQREGRGRREGPDHGSDPLPEGSGRGRGPQVGLAGGGRSALCVARAEPRLCPRSLGARLPWGGGAVSRASPGR